MAARLGWLVACYGNFTHGSEEKNQDPRRSGRSTCTDALHDAATNIIATRKDRNDTFMADPASYTREIETRRETTSLVIINSDAPMVAEARSIMLSGSSTPKNAQAGSLQAPKRQQRTTRPNHQTGAIEASRKWENLGSDQRQWPRTTSRGKLAGKGTRGKTQQAKKPRQPGNGSAPYHPARFKLI